MLIKSRFVRVPTNYISYKRISFFIIELLVVPAFNFLRKNSVFALSSDLLEINSKEIYEILISLYALARLESLSET